MNTQSFFSKKENAEFSKSFNSRILFELFLKITCSIWSLWNQGSVKLPLLNRDQHFFGPVSLARAVNWLTLTQIENWPSSSGVKVARSSSDITNVANCLTLRRPLRRKVRMRWFFDISKVKESSFSKSDLTDPPSDFWCAFFRKYQFNSHAVGVKYCLRRKTLRCRYGRCVAILDFFFAFFF